MANFMNFWNRKGQREKVDIAAETKPERQMPLETNRAVSASASVIAEDTLLSAQIRKEALEAVKRRGIKNF